MLYFSDQVYLIMIYHSVLVLTMSLEYNLIPSILTICNCCTSYTSITYHSFHLIAMKHFKYAKNYCYMAIVHLTKRIRNIWWESIMHYVLQRHSHKKLMQRSSLLLKFVFFVNSNRQLNIPVCTSNKISAIVVGRNSAFHFKPVYWDIDFRWLWYIAS